MPLSPGTKLGPYEILSAAGAGGMGEIYRARDTRLDRTVAIKVLPEQFSQNADLKQRFEREARAISALNHPNICTLYDVGHQDGTDYLVLEYIEGESLSSRLMKGPLPVEQVLKTGSEIAEALEKAHRQGIVHRDLKPGNVMLTKSGAKLLDFGLAKPQGGVAQPGSVLTQAITQTSPASPITQQGTLVGTFQYMAPEQVEGKEADARSDIFALGAVLYEMATGKRAFEGKSAISVASAILEKEPEPISKQQPLTPPALEQVVKGCLAKDPEERFQTAHDVKLQLKWIAEGGSSAVGLAPPVSARRRLSQRAAWAVAAVAILAAVLLAIGFVLRAPRPGPVLRASLNLPPGSRLDDQNSCLAFSPDGHKLVFVAQGTDGKQQLWLRSMDSLAAQPLAGTEDATYPFWSPDGRYIGFFAEHKLKKIDASGGTVQTICDASDGRGATWSQRGVVVFARQPFGGLSIVSAAGGDPAPLTTVTQQDMSHRLPHFLPDGRHLLFFSGRQTAGKDSAIMSLDLDSKQSQLVAQQNSEGFYVAPGYLIFVRESNLMAQPFDPGTRRTTGDATPIAEHVAFNPFRWTGAYAVSNTGLLLYQGGGGTMRGQLTWFDMDGKRVGTVGEPARFQNIYMAPGGKRALVEVADSAGDFNLWMYDLARGTATRFSFGARNFVQAVWSPDGRQVVYANDAGQLFLKDAGGTAEAQPLTSDRTYRWPTAWSPDGKFLAFQTQTTAGWDIWMMSMEGDHKSFPFLATPANDWFGSFSPDGKWFSYFSDESGRSELYVVPFPGPGAKRQISLGGATEGGWLNDHQITYITLDRKLVVVDVSAKGQELEIGEPRFMFGGKPQPALLDPNTGFAPPSGYFSADGKRILLRVPVEESATPVLTLVSNWPADLKK
jgi:Tol biopolymer transport system component/tRNA A-37 threonylcarbamoyl transferase component Bud32